MRVPSIHPRLRDWTERLAELWARCANAPFEWGEQDCVSFAANAAIALTGVDPLHEYRGKYHDEETAYEIVGGDGLQAFVARLMAEFGAVECPISFAQRGDWSMVLVNNQLVTGVIAGGTIVAPGARKLVHVPLARAVVAWAI